MQVITTHVNTDFDGLGAMLAAAKLYPEAALYFPGHLSRQVREFYSLHKDALPIKAPEMLHLGTVSELIIVDTQQPLRIGRFRALLDDPNVRVIIYDHHPPPDTPITGAILHHAEVGAVTSFLVNQLREQNISVSEMEATVMALGIYADTACLTSVSTALQDIEALQYLVSQGANLSVIQQHLNSPLNQEQRLLLEELLANSERHCYQGVSALITVCSVDEYIDGLGLLTERLATIEDVDLVFCLAEMDGRIHMTGRSRHNHLPINEVMQHFGGGGHPLAAAATIKGRSLLELKQQLVTYLAETLRPPFVAADLMSSPVHATHPEATMEEVGQAMLRYGHGGLPVVENDRLVGIISRRDVDKSIHHGLQHAPVKGFMTTQVVTIGPDASLDEIQRLLIGKDIGRLPVVDADGQVVGIVTRTDVLRALHGRSYPHWYQSNVRPLLDPRARADTLKLTNLMTERLPKRLQGLLLLIGQEAQRQQVKAYLVGGMVRDLLLNVPNFDVDIVIEPAAIPFAEHLSKIFGGAVRTYPQFNTATLTTPDGITIDLVTARTEFYANPAALPEVEYSTIKQDLYRRDFTINTMAIDLVSSRYGQLLDFFNARADLDEGLIRVLYNLSFVEDPTRILRAIRFEQRYHFQIEPETLRFLHNALEHDLLSKVSEERIRAELEQLLAEDNAPHVILRMHELGVLDAVLPGIHLTDDLIRHLRDARDHISWFEQLQTEKRLKRWLVYLLLLASNASAKDLSTWPRRLALAKTEREMLLSFAQAREQLAAGLTDSVSDEQIYEQLREQPLECQAAVAVLHGETIRQHLARYWGNLAHVRVETDGYDLLGLGLKPGPQVGEILRRLHLARLGGQVTNKDEELAWVRRLLATPEEGR